MSFVKKTLDVIHNVLTLGGASLFDDAQKQYANAWQEYSSKIELYNDVKNNIEATTTRIGEHITLFQSTLKEAAHHLKSNQVLDGDYSTKKAFIGIDEFNKKLSHVESSQSESIIAGSSAGIASSALVTGSWALVSILGTASTGTAIGSISGIAATNATLAWFGGGSLAAGGAGMAGGAAVISGLVAIPIIYFATKSAYSKVEELKEHTFELVSEKEKLDIAIPQIISIRDNVNKKELLIKSICSDYVKRTDLAINYLKIGENYQFNLNNVWLCYLSSLINIYLPIFRTSIEADQLQTLNILSDYLQFSSGFKSSHYPDMSYKYIKKIDDNDNKILFLYEPNTNYLEEEILYSKKDKPRAIFKFDKYTKLLRNAEIKYSDGVKHSEITGEFKNSFYFLSLDTFINRTNSNIKSEFKFKTKSNYNLDVIHSIDINYTYKTDSTFHIFIKHVSRKLFQVNVSVSNNKRLKISIKKDGDFLILTTFSKIKIKLMKIFKNKKIDETLMIINNLRKEVEESVSDMMIFSDQIIFNEKFEKIRLFNYL